jgi:hypothetical protein
MNVKPIVDHKFELPPDGWCHGIPICEVRIDAREVFEDAPKGEIITHVNDAAALDAIIASFRQDAAQYKSRVGAEFPGLLVDKEHFSYDTDKETEAQAWVMDMERRADGLWVKMRFSDVGRQRVTGGSFRFLSPTVLHRQSQLIETRREPDGNKNTVMRPLRVDSFALTNKHRLKLLKPISSREPGDSAAAGTSQPIPRAEGNKESRMDYKAMLLAFLSLQPDATDEQVQKALDARKAAETTAQTKADAMKCRATTAETRVSQLERTILETQVEQDLNQFADRIENRDETRKQLLTNREGALAVLKSVKAPIVAAATNDQRILNREAGTAAPASAASDEAKVKLVKAEIKNWRINNRDSNGKTPSYQRAWEAVKTEKPELFI